jgi:hypothetical protein
MPVDNLSLRLAPASTEPCSSTSAPGACRLSSKVVLQRPRHTWRVRYNIHKHGTRCQVIKMTSKQLYLQHNPSDPVERMAVTDHGWPPLQTTIASKQGRHTTSGSREGATVPHATPQVLMQHPWQGALRGRASTDARYNKTDSTVECSLLLC